MKLTDLVDGLSAALPAKRLDSPFKVDTRALGDGAAVVIGYHLLDHDFVKIIFRRNGKLGQYVHPVQPRDTAKTIVKLFNEKHP